MNTVRAVNLRTYISGATEAHKAVHCAIARGDLPHPSAHSCVDCGGPAEEYDHRDYNKPLEVEPVCHSCNGVRGAAKPKDYVAPYVVEKEDLPIEVPKVVPMSVVESCRTFREACVKAWEMRGRKNMTRATLAEMAGIYPAHLSDFLSSSATNDRGVERRELLAKHIPAFERAVGNALVSQWLAYQSGYSLISLAESATYTAPKHADSAVTAQLTFEVCQ